MCVCVCMCVIYTCVYMLACVSICFFKRICLCMFVLMHTLTHKQID